MQHGEKIWINGEIVDWAEARVHIAAHGLHYGTGVLEGIRAYETRRGSAILRLTDHLQRLFSSSRLLHMSLPYTLDEIRQAVMELAAVNGLDAFYIRPIAFFGEGDMGVAPRENPVDVAVLIWPWGPYLGAESLSRGVRATVSSW